ncbi:acetyl-CoA carboxylase, carboxyltransferase subunit beta [Selenihalanaerobacter shriftii]|uniref:Acetyl-coenzyme A carboxylase carboxyl transferase subunit beta n=1 Tax=Selenihalanaerobacter shriftii TaxID=142842 RepID=A0A1T4Q1T3_9FIRM|nr:acetyl-CoA carboxylase, carboxyltransferase subunit beta [Selenihalanaerobacter shriftii]SJZ97566.1 acetyl-CoA carboxylase carboxyl transferase subunit beta [Selenihalanaerobacter shriftii]
MFKDWFGNNKSKYVTVKRQKEDTKRKKKRKKGKGKITDELWTKCKNCGEIIFNKKLTENLKVCLECGYHFRLNSQERLKILIDEDSFKEYDENIETTNPLGFPKYDRKLDKYQQKTGLNEAVVTGEGKVGGYDVIISVIDASFLMGSMNSVVGEKITRAIESALAKNSPLIIVSGGGGGARMYEGMLSLMQMAKTSSALAKLDDAGQLFISVLTDPTYGGISASFASLGDIIIAESDAKIGFAGPRVIKQTINKDLPQGFQTAKFQLKHGMVDKVVNREEMKDTIVRILDIHSLRGEVNA